MIFMLKILLGGLLGYIGDLHIVYLTAKETLITRADFLKRLLNIPVYTSGMLVLVLLAMIPIYDKTVFVFLYCIIGALVCCTIELGWGYLLNIKLKMGIWGYNQKITIFGKEIPLNIMGQTDLNHFAMFIGLSFLAITFSKNIDLFSKLF